MRAKVIFACCSIATAMVLERARPVARPRPAPPKPPALPPSLAPPETGSLDDAGPLYLSLSSLFSQIGARLRQTEAPYDAATIKDVLALLGRAELNPVEWEQFSEQRSDRYTRNVVAVDERFVALCLTWDAGQASKIHDHAGSSCFVKLLSGDLEEQKYAARYADGTWRELGGPEAVATGQATYMDDSRGLHRISNPNTETPAVSLHIYAPGFEECGIYGDDGDVTTGSMVSAMGVASDEATLDQGKLSLATLGDELAGGAADVDALLARLELTPAEQREYCSGACFSEFGYARHLAHISADYSVVVCCWLAGQASDRHVHGEDQRSWTKVLHGRLEYAFPDAGEEGHAAHVVLEPGRVFGEEHWMKTESRIARNPSSDSVCVSLHVRSPPLTTQGFDRIGARDAVRHAAAAPDALAAARVRGNNLYTSVGGLTNLLDEAFAAGGDVADVTNVLANARLNEREWRNYARWNKDTFSRVLVADREDYNMFLVAWERGNFSPVHDHAGSASWTKVLEGELDEAVYGVAPSGELRLERSGPMSAGVTYAHEGFIHGCVASTRCFTLQVYSPPYKSANAYDADGATTKIPTHVRGDRVDGDKFTEPASPVLHDH
ncbi:unnamed protein product [Pelagomonas calceolata]|uniref:cysteine dioxygenase n=1 Tax=Pelagomonas calceolata TaxID=35677 RepID=A0A8J2SVE5_9STRA|nr:unnamed protein product [Pelagomonas calceolata]|mmetsp:Transcript_5834/g.16433  ORF Transcript_5834/g.16433 Transcript_5834/m.16433 type:complete len:610 (-) Transcript_5834:64-1893(-)